MRIFKSVRTLTLLLLRLDLKPADQGLAEGLRAFFWFSAPGGSGIGSGGSCRAVRIEPPTESERNNKAVAAQR